MKCVRTRRPAVAILGLGVMLTLALTLIPQPLPAQQPTTAAPAPAEEPSTAGSTPTKTQKVNDLTSRYRFSERYTRADEQVAPGMVGAYRVAIVEKLKDSMDSLQGAPKRTESSRHAIFSERPAEMGLLGTVTSVVRTFEHFESKPEGLNKRVGSRPFDKLSIMVRPRSGELPSVMGLIEGRSLTEFEYDLAARQVFVAQVANLLPTQVIRVGDSWRISRKAIQAILGDPFLMDDGLIGKLTEIRKEVDGPRMVAVIAISGKVNGPSGETSINAETLFTFVPESSLKGFSTKPSFPPRPTEDITEARGAITELRMARSTSGPLPGTGRLRFVSTRELTLHRQLGLVPGAASPPKLEKFPDLTEANSWLTHIDPAGRYLFQHPQDLLLPDRTQPSADANTSLLVRTRREGRDMLQVECVPKVLQPDDLRKLLAEKYKVLRMEVVKGEEVWLPEADWPRMKVHRIDAEIKVGDPKSSASLGSTRIHFDGYLILFGQSTSVLAIASTSRNAVGPYRQEIEKILKSIQLDPARPALD